MTINTAESRTVTGANEESSGEPTRQQKGAIIRRRWLDAGFKSKNDFANRSPFDRKTLTKIEAGTAEDATYERVMAWLDNYTGEPSAPPQVEQIEFTVEGDFGVKVTVKGPIRDRSELEQSVANIIRSIRESSPPTGSS